MADLGFPVGGRGPRRRRCGLPRRLHFENFVCQNERIGTLRGGAHRARPLDLPMHLMLAKMKSRRRKGKNNLIEIIHSFIFDTYIKPLLASFCIAEAIPLM